MSSLSQRFRTSSGEEIEAVFTPAKPHLPKHALVALALCERGPGKRSLGSFDAAKLASRGSLSLDGSLLVPALARGSQSLEAGVCAEICDWVKGLLEAPAVGPLGPRSRLSSLAASRVAS